jgi:two-component system, chemotaxis family, response regulator Rcp1
VKNVGSSTVDSETPDCGSCLVDDSITARYPTVRPGSILLVEDNPADARLVREALKEAQIPVQLCVASDGADALDFVLRRGPHSRAPRPDLILLDLNLPKRNGSEVLRLLKADPDLRRIPVIVMTTSRAEQDIRGAYDLNANCYIEKPVELDRFLEVLKSIEDFWLRTATLPNG